MHRDTDLDWRLLGEGEPYYGVLTQDRFLRKNLTPESLDEFWSSGEHHIRQIINLIERHFGPFSIGSALDFGCGVGRLSRGMAKFAGNVVGVDVSPGMLAEARLGAPSNITFTHEVAGEGYDWINSIIVFQHIPPERGYAILESLLSRLNMGGIFSLQFPIYRDQAPLLGSAALIQEAVWDGVWVRSLSDAPLPPGSMLMYDYDLAKIISIAVRNGVDSYFLEHMNHGGFHDVTMYARKTR